jgi:hypothetical protein
VPTTTVFRYGEFLQTFPSRYCPHTPATHRCTPRGPQDTGVAACRRRCLRSGQGRPGGCSTAVAPRPECRALPRNRRLRHTRGGRASTAQWGELAFYPKKLSGAGTRYSTLDRELLAAFSAVRHFRFLLEGRQFRLLTDHKPLVISLFRTTPTWLQNVVEDALSRPPAAAAQQPLSAQSTSPVPTAEDWPEEGLVAPERPALAKIHRSSLALNVFTSLHSTVLHFETVRERKMEDCLLRPRDLLHGASRGRFASSFLRETCGCNTNIDSYLFEYYLMLPRTRCTVQQ